jgi:tetratricopeptide (TPR) repeat protein
MKRIAQVTAAALALLLLGGIGLRVAAPGGANAGNPAPGGATAAGPAPAPEAFTGPAATNTDLAGTIASLQDRLRAVPDDADALTALGLAQVQLARTTGDPTAYPRADEALARAVRLQGGADAAPSLTWIGLGALALARHDFSEALRDGREAAERNPDDGDVYGVIGDALVELGRYRAAFDTFQTMVDTEPGVAAYARVSYARELRGDVRGAIEAMAAAEEISGTASDAAWTSTNVGQLRLRSGDVDGAARDFRRAVALDPSFVPAQAGLARVAYARRHLDEAIARGEDVVARYPSTEYVIWLSEVYAAAGDRERARQQEQVVRAIEQLALANGVNVDLEAALFEADHGDPKAALEAARQEWSRRHSIHVADAMAWALHVNGRDRAASRFADLALRLGTRDALLRYHAGMIALALGDRAEAAELLSGALEIDPGFSPLHAPLAERALSSIGGRT